MTKQSLEDERNAVDIVTDCMMSLDFLQGISNWIFSHNRDDMTVGQFYDRWLKESSPKEVKIPFNPGAIMGCIYCGILFSRENWDDLLPDVKFADADLKWGISGVPFTSPKKANPSFRDVVRRIRNALGHANFTINIPKDMKRDEIMDRFKLKFHDENARDAADIFDIELSLSQLSTFIKVFQSTIHQNVRSKKN